MSSASKSNAFIADQQVPRPPVLARRMLDDLGRLPYDKTELFNNFTEARELAYAAALLVAINTKCQWFMYLRRHIKGTLRVTESLAMHISNKMRAFGLLEQNGARREWRIALPPELQHIHDEYIQSLSGMSGAEAEMSVVTDSGALTADRQQRLDRAFAAAVANCEGNAQLMRMLGQRLLRQ
jgi:hypothetical protein